MLGRCNDASFHRCIRRFTDSTDVSIHSSIHECIKCVRCGSFVILFRYFAICCAVVLVISGLIWVSFCQFGVPFSRHFCVQDGLLATLRPPGVPREGQGRKCEQKGGSWVHPWTLQKHPKSIKINRNLKVHQCVGVGMHCLCPRCRQLAAGYAQTTVNTMVLNEFHVWHFFVFFMFLDRSGHHFC